MIRRWNMVLPPPSWAVVFVLLFAVLEGPLLYAQWRWGLGPNQIPVRPGTQLLLVAAVALGYRRVIGFHPFYDANYRAWLAMTPWTSRKPLPGGPVSLVWEDVLPVAALMALTPLLHRMNPLAVAIAFLGGYLAFLLPTLWKTGSWASGYAVAFGLGLVVRLWGDPPNALAAAIATVLVAEFGLRRSLARFPWGDDSNKFRANFDVDEARKKMHGWPIDVLAPRPMPERAIGRRDVILVSLLVGWWFHAVIMRFDDPRNHEAVREVTCLMVVQILVVMRFLMYFGGAKPPISLLGRLRTFRWIIPGYDQILVAPIVTILAAATIGRELNQANVDPDITRPIVISFALLMALGLGPTLRTWRLTGKFRMYMLNSPEYVKLG